MREINLLPKSSAKSMKGESILRVIRGVALVSLGVVGMTAVALFIIKLQSPLDQVKKQEKDLLSQFSAAENKVLLYGALQDRLDAISVLLSKRSTFDKTIGQISDLLTKDMTLSALSLNEHELTFTVSSPSLSSADTFLSSIVALADEKNAFKKVTLASFAFEPASKRYFFTMDIVL